MNEVNAALSQPLHQAVQNPILLSAFAAQIQAREKVLLEQYIITPEDAYLRAAAEVLRVQGQINKIVANITKFVPASTLRLGTATTGGRKLQPKLR